MTGLDAAGTGDEELDDGTLGSRCVHPASPTAATAVAALSATEKFRCIL
jgi:hypothetical protein